jgi:hypothetical protein
VEDKLFFFLNGEIERREDPGTIFVANQDDSVEFGESRVSADVMNQIKTRMMEVYGYIPVNMTLYSRYRKRKNITQTRLEY